VYKNLKNSIYLEVNFIIDKIFYWYLPVILNIFCIIVVKDKSMIKLIHGDCKEALKGLEDNSIDSVVTDAPYELGFMGKAWDKSGITYNVDLWREVLRVLKPGGHLLAFGGTRTYHRMACAIEDAGFDVRDQIQWLHGQGFPKSLNIGKEVDELQGNEREVVGYAKSNPDLRDVGRISKENCGIDKLSFGQGQGAKRQQTAIDKGSSPYEGWGTALKPANEPICLARKPLSEKTVASNVLKWGTGSLNIDQCRVKTEIPQKKWEKPRGGIWTTDSGTTSELIDNQKGRWPANIIHDGSEEVLQYFPDTKSGFMKRGTPRLMSNNPNKNCYGYFNPDTVENDTYGDLGSASRFFYTAKASKSERNFGLNEFEAKKMDLSRKEGNPGGDNPRNRGVNQRLNNHPTIKPVSLMRYLCRLITPPKGIILDPFMGSGSTGIGAKLEGFSFIGIEKEDEYCKIAEARIDAWKSDGKTNKKFNNIQRSKSLLDKEDQPSFF
jgi:site-specific DNA-methyltransferase (adenine-specific)